MNAAPPEAGLLASLRGLLVTATGMLRTRLELFVVELEEEKAHLLTLLLYGAAAFFFLTFGLVMLAIFLTVLFWDSHRLVVIGGFTGLFLTCGAGAVFLVWRLLHRHPRLFAASLDELARDRAALQGGAADEGRNVRP